MRQPLLLIASFVDAQLDSATWRASCPSTHNPARCTPACRGLETLVLLAAWKLTLPAAVYLLRGNHESATCTLMYGFKGELVAKYGKRDWRVRGVG